MSPRLFRLFALLCLCGFIAAPADASRPQHAARPLAPARNTVIDLERRLDINRAGLVITNLGSLGYDLVQGNTGLWYPRDSSTTLMFASGLWLGSLVDGSPRVTVGEYSVEYAPGRMSGAGPGTPLATENRVWKVQRWSGDPADTAHVDRAPGGPAVDPLVHHSWSEYIAGAVPIGAPWKLHRLPDPTTLDPLDSLDVPGPDVLGDQMTWCVYNDADPANHTNGAGSTAPLGAEVEQAVFGFNDQGPLGEVAFVHWRVINRSLSTWTGLRAGYWVDPDIGGGLGFTDDKVGCDTTRSLAFAYNGQPIDGGYGDHPPLLGALLLDSSPLPSGGATTGMHAFASYVGGTDPNNAQQSLNSLSGLNADGTPIIDPLSNETRFRYSGDALGGTGWLDPSAADKRMMASFAPREVLPGDSLDLWVAIVVSPGVSLSTALASMPCRADYVRAVFASGFAEPRAVAPECEVPRNCPRPVSYWGAQCAGAGAYDATRLGALANAVDQSSAALDFGSDPRLGFCATMAASGGVRALAEREFAAFLTNYLAGPLQIQPVGQTPVLLLPSTPVSCPGVAADDVASLATPASSGRGVSGSYLNLVTDHRRPIEGVDFGLSGFGGGVGSAYDFLGSSLDPSVQPDSFPAAVVVHFDSAQTQKAYRYLRNELVGGGLPAVGRGYRFAGFLDVPFTARDSASGDPLDVAYVERVVTDDAGTIQPAASQPASFDSSWAPTTEPDGNREYLLISRRAYSGSPLAEFVVDGAATSSSVPWLFAMAARRRAEPDVFDDGDEFVFRFGYAQTPGVDAVLRDLASRSLSDSGVAEKYTQIAECLGAINRAETVGPYCDEPTPALASLVSAEAEPGRVRVEWRVPSPNPVTIERRPGDQDWSDLALRVPNGEGRVVLEDRNVQAGTRYGYRLRLGTSHLGEVTLDVPVQNRLSLAGLRPNPAAGSLVVAFTLASSAPAQLEVLDVAGRRVFARAIDRPLAGQRVLSLTGARLSPGVYVVRLTQDGAQLVTRGVVLR